jgi:putative phosphoesterase
MAIARAQRLAKQSATLAPRPDGTLRLVVVADTHSAPHPNAAAHIAARRPDAILHAGDIGDLAVIAGLRAIAPTYVIRGNIDVRGDDLPDLLTLDVGDALRILMVHIGVNGPRLRPEVARMARAEKAGLVVCGHSHVPFIGEERGLLVFNPGSVGPRRFHLPIVFGTIELSPAGLAMAHVDAESGRPWLPPA